jgi:selenoprotein W-related protein
MQKTPRIEIAYCTHCRWLLRAAWMAQELLTTYSTVIGELALVPGTGGIFEIRIGDETVWSRADKGRFSEIKFPYSVGTSIAQSGTRGAYRLAGNEPA